jgi:hypothetical protein
MREHIRYKKIAIEKAKHSRSFNPAYFLLPLAEDIAIFAKARQMNSKGSPNETHISPIKRDTIVLLLIDPASQSCP